MYAVHIVFQLSFYFSVLTYLYSSIATPPQIISVPITLYMVSGSPRKKPAINTVKIKVIDERGKATLNLNIERI